MPLRFKPTSPKRLSTHERPIPMRGDPPWHGTKKTAWEARQRVVYQAAMAAKQLELPLNPPETDT